MAYHKSGYEYESYSPISFYFTISDLDMDANIHLVP